MKKNNFWRSRVAGFMSFSLVLVFSATTTAQEEREKRWYGQPFSVSPSQVINGDYFAYGPQVEVSGTVNGDVYAVGGQILIDGQVNGDVLVAGGQVTVSGNVSQDARVAGGQVSFSGTIGRNLTVAGGNVELTQAAVVRGGLVGAGGSIHLAAPLGRGVKVAAGSLIISNRIPGHVHAAVDSLRLTSKAEVRGDINYFSHREASIESGAKVVGKLVRKTPRGIPRIGRKEVFAALAGWGLFMVAVSFVSTLILGLLSVRFFPRYHRSVITVLRQRPLVSFGVGFIAAVVTPILCGILFASVFGLPIGMILTAAYLILLYWGRIFVISGVGDALLSLFRGSPGQGWAFVSGLVIYYLLAIIPIIGWLLVLLVVTFGLGADLIARKEFYVAARNQEMV